MNWTQLEIEQAVETLGTDLAAGLTTSEAESRRAAHGLNELVERGGRTPLTILWEQLTATMVVILMAAAVAAAVLGDTKNAVAILAVVALYALLGFVQEYRAERAIASLKRMSVPVVQVRRDGRLQEISARDLVPGDVVQLQTGNIVPADGRLVEAANLRIEEAALTGESEPVAKRTDALAGDALPLGDRRNMAYMGTTVSQGRGLALVVATGMETELGKIATLIQQTTVEQTPLQRRLDQLGKALAAVGVVVAALVLVLGLLRGDDIRHMVLTAVSVAVAIVPEGLPAVVTITLALGAQRMLQQNALVRKLSAVETLGSVTVICSDKTGTLTENRMTVVVLDVAGRAMDLTEEMKGDSVRQVRDLGLPVESSLSLLAIGGALCNDARLVSGGDDRYHTVGDPTEGALVAAAARMGYWQPRLEAALPRADEVPFDSERKRMTTIHAVENAPQDALAGLDPAGSPFIAFTKGSVDGLLDLAGHVWSEGRAEPMDEGWHERIQGANDRLARKGMRVLGLAYRLLDGMPDPVSPAVEADLVFVGLFGMIDPPRAEVRDAIALTRTAGVRTAMITGDHPLTAAEIARQLGITEDGRILTGAELDRTSFDALRGLVDEVRVFARVSPEHKLTIVQALQENGQVVAMTGDGVNDAQALRRAEIGVAMGITGTDVAKEASDLVLLDDNFSTIVAAVREGRTIYDNIRKFVRFSVAGNIGKVMVMLLAPFLGKPIPLLPLQLLWLNLLTDGLLGLGMGVEPPEGDTMRRPPYSPREGVFSRGAAVQTAAIGVLIGALGLALGAGYYFGGRDNWQTMVFTSLAFAQIGQAMAARTNQQFPVSVDLRSNRLMLAMVAVVALLQLGVVYLRPMQSFFGTSPLSVLDLGIAVGAGAIVLAAVEVAKRNR